MLSSIPPQGGVDPVINSGVIAPRCEWAGYLSATSVYGDRDGQWAFEDEQLYPKTQRGKNRIEAELSWLEADFPTHVFRLAGIYGPDEAGRSRNAFGKIRAGNPAVIKPGHIVNRVHVADIVSALLASLAAPDPGQIYNIADGNPAPPQDVLGFAAKLLGRPAPRAVNFAEAQMSDMARSFYQESKRVDISRAKAQLGWTPRFPDYRAGLRGISAGLNEKP